MERRVVVGVLVGFAFLATACSGKEAIFATSCQPGMRVGERTTLRVNATGVDEFATRWTTSDRAVAGFVIPTLVPGPGTSPEAFGEQVMVLAAGAGAVTITATNHTKDEFGDEDVRDTCRILIEPEPSSSVTGGASSPPAQPGT